MFSTLKFYGPVVVLVVPASQEHQKLVFLLLQPFLEPSSFASHSTESGTNQVIYACLEKLFVFVGKRSRLIHVPFLHNVDPTDFGRSKCRIGTAWETDRQQAVLLLKLPLIHTLTYNIRNTCYCSYNFDSHEYEPSWTQLLGSTAIHSTLCNGNGRTRRRFSFLSKYPTRNPKPCSQPFSRLITRLLFKFNNPANPCPSGTSSQNWSNGIGVWRTFLHLFCSKVLFPLFSPKLSFLQIGSFISE